MTEKELSVFYKANGKAIKTHCKHLGIPVSEVELVTSSLNPAKVTYYYSGKVILTSEACYGIKIKVRRHGV